jgi:hypothetical protein
MRPPEGFLMWRKTLLSHRGEMACSVGDPGQGHTGWLLWGVWLDMWQSLRETGDSMALQRRIGMLQGAA